ncbi:hypothetical protein CAEBREN_18558 [Caenorhabditis brenneri]|uniref:Uncharacterized protein n=1 Tax=Caenorhabditis brenneri TaxID=135651 RepID=G0NGJ5_CAEBE|nr:hypothetical protein CAEBREN_18558 [Caenorhabditis brenneri]
MGLVESDEENEEASRGREKVSPHSLPSTSGSSESQMGVAESRSPSPAPLPEQTHQKPTPMKEEPMEDMEDASNVPSTSRMATLPVERFIKEERVHEMEEAWYAPPRPPRPFNWTPYPSVPFFESQNVNLDDLLSRRYSNLTMDLVEFFQKLEISEEQRMLLILYIASQPDSSEKFPVETSNITSEMHASYEELLVFKREDLEKIKQKLNRYNRVLEDLRKQYQESFKNFLLPKSFRFYFDVVKEDEPNTDND